MAFKFKGQALPSYVVINDIKDMLMPPVNQKTEKVPGRAGQYDFGNEIGERKIKVSFTIIANDEVDLRTKIRDFANYLYSDDAQPLVMDFEPTKTYYAKVNGEIEVDEVLRTGKGDFTFVCYDPYAYGDERTLILYDGGYPVDLIKEFDMTLDANKSGIADDFTKTDAAGVTVVYTIEDNAQKAQVTSSTASASPYLGSTTFTANPGEMWCADMYIKVTEKVGGYTPEIGVVFLDSNNTYLGTQAVYTVTSTTSDYTYFRTPVVTAPANTAKVQVRLRSKTSASGDRGTCYFKQVKLYKVNTTAPDIGATVNVNSPIPAYPKLTFNFNGNTTEFLATAGERYLYFGQPQEVEKTPTSKRVRVFVDDCTSVAGYTAGIGVDYNGTMTGTLTSDGSVIKVSNYGTGTGWHGGAGVKSIGQQIQDFSVYIDVGFLASKASEVGMLEIYLLDQNNAVIGKMAMRDAWATDNPLLIARAGNYTTGKVFVAYAGYVGRWKQFKGRLKLSRIGQTWEFSAMKQIPTTKGIKYDTFTYRFYDKDNLYNQKLAGFQIYIASYGSSPVVANMYFDRIEIWNENLTIDPNTQIPNVFESGDVLEIDNSTGEILKNSEAFYYALDPTSKYLKLAQGANVINVYPRTVISSASLTFRERWY